MSFIKEIETFRLQDAVTFHTELNPKLFIGNRLRPEVEKQLKIIAEDFIEEMGLSDIHVEDVTISGSNAAYSYTEHSDLDLHLLVDFSKINDNKEIVKNYVGGLKSKWNDSHDIRIGNHPVEVYIQDVNEVNRSQAVYSLTKNTWVKKPQIEDIQIDKATISKKYKEYVTFINTAVKEQDLDKLKRLVKRLYEMREAGLAKSGEYSTENLVFKLLRSSGYVNQLKDAINNITDKNLSHI